MKVPTSYLIWNHELYGEMNGLMGGHCHSVCASKLPTYSYEFEIIFIIFFQTIAAEQIKQKANLGNVPISKVRWFCPLI